METFKQTIILLFWFIAIVKVLQTLINKLDNKNNYYQQDPEDH